MGCSSSKKTPVATDPAPAPDAKPAAPEPEAADPNEPENGHAPLLEKMAATSAAWQAMNGQAARPDNGMAFPVALVADQDEASRTESGWASHLAYGKLVYRGDEGAASYTFELSGEAPLATERGDKSGRGAEYSALEVFNGKLITVCDRTGNMDELVPAEGFGFTIKPALDAEGNPINLPMGDGSKKNKPLKCEWSTQKGGKLYVGSTGKERTDDDGNIVHEGEMYIKVIDAAGAIEHVDWRGMYNGLRDAAICRPGAGYIIHESARWSDVHGQWLFLPRKSSRQPYDEVKDAHKCVNLMMCAPEGLGEAQGDKVALKDYLTKSDLRGCSDFLFVPGTNDCHLFVVRTEETLEGAITTYCSVIDLAANVLMGEMTLAADRKFEGAAWVGGFGPFPPNGPTEEVALPPAAETAAEAKADEPATEPAAEATADEPAAKSTP